jgi:hypothetical protein
MAESQSRYGIMEELNSKKLQAKQELSNLESAKELGIAQRQDNIDKTNSQISATEGTYKINHGQWKVKKLSDLRIKKLEYERTVKNIEEEVTERDANYEQEFLNWKDMQLKNVEFHTKDLENFKKTQDRLIAAKKEILTEIDAGITNLKEMSKEQKEK